METEARRGDATRTTRTRTRGRVTDGKAAAGKAERARMNLTKADDLAFGAETHVAAEALQRSFRRKRANHPLRSA